MTVDKPRGASTGEGLEEIFDHSTRFSTRADKTILRVSEVDVRFGGVLALDALSFSAELGELVAVIGPNGAGKSTLLNTISGLNWGNGTGNIEFCQQAIWGHSPVQIARLGIGRSFQNPPLLEKETVVENVMVGLHERLTYRLSDQLLRPRRVANAEREMRQRARGLLELVGLGDASEEPIANVSYGTRKLVDIMRAIVAGPRLLLLDEPTSGLDAHERASVEKLLIRLRNTRRVTILLVEHHMDLVRSVADTVIGLQAGTLLMAGTPNDVLDSDTFRIALIGAR